MLMPDNKGLNYMVATTCKWENSGSKWHINSTKVATMGKRDNINLCQCKINTNNIKD